jgi:sarcosine oxidase, subunit gamma
MNSALRLEDLSWRPRFGCKGPGAQDWLTAQGYGVPMAANSASLEAGVLVARLATSEFLVEAVGSAPGAQHGADPGAQRVAATGMQLSQGTRPAVVYPVAREDTVIGLRGAGLNAVLRQTCSVDFAPWFDTAQDGAVLMTSLAGVGVLAWPQRTGQGASLTLWSDPTFAHYLWSTLLEVGADAGGVTRE